MAAPMSNHVENNINNDLNEVTATLKKGEMDVISCVTSKQLLYSEKFPDRTNDSLKVTKKTPKEHERDHKTFRFPPSSVLSQVKGFLPKLASSNSDLKGKESEFCIENVELCTGPVIELDLALVQMNSDTDSGDDSESSCDSSDSESDDNMTTRVTESNIKLSNSKSPRHHRGDLIKVLSTNLHLDSGTDPREATLSSQSPDVSTSTKTSACSKEGPSVIDSDVVK